MAVLCRQFGISLSPATSQTARVPNGPCVNLFTTFRYPVVTMGFERL
jgi:hypothetical protein